MATYLIQAQGTDQGIRNVKESPKRLDLGGKKLKEMGGEMKAFYMTMGKYDSVAIVDVPNDETFVGYLLRLGSQGNLRTHGEGLYRGRVSKNCRWDKLKCVRHCSRTRTSSARRLPKGKQAMGHQLGPRWIIMSRRLPIAIIALSLGAVLTVIGCASTEDRQREARAADFNQWLGQSKQSRVRQVGPPDSCTGTQTGGGELCEWRPNGNSLRYRYDTNGMARSWTYTNRQLGVIEKSEDQASQVGVWQSVTNWFTKEPKRAPGSGS